MKLSINLIEVYLMRRIKIAIDIFSGLSCNYSSGPLNGRMVIGMRRSVVVRIIYIRLSIFLFFNENFLKSF
jgi:hypothetical protein